MTDANPQQPTAPQPAPEQNAVALLPKNPGMSAEIDQLATALALAKGQMFSPVRNKHVTVTRKKGGTYNFRYSSLDVINDMVRLPLFENGLSIMHLMRPNARGELFMASRLLHKSGQYMDTVLPIDRGVGFADEDVISGPQKLGSLMTFAKRYNICALLDIASQDDDDANVAEGNMVIDHEYPTDPAAQFRVLQDRYARLCSAAKNARDPAGVGEVLQRWQRGMEFWHAMRLDPDPSNWIRLMTVIPAAIELIHGKVLADVFRDAAVASSTEQMNAVRATWESQDGREARGAMKELNPISYGMLFEHLREQAARVEREEEEAQARQQHAAEEASLGGALQDEGSPFEGKRLEAPAAAEQRLDMTYRQVRDEFGEIITDEIYRETEWAEAYVAQWQESENRQALHEHNADGLAWVERIVEAQVILQQGLGKHRFAQPEPAAATTSEPASADAIAVTATEASTATASSDSPLEDARQLPLLPEVPVVTLHKTARGTPDLGRYLRAVKISLDQVDIPDVPRWEAVNLPVVDGLPRGTQLEVLGVLARRKQALGIAA